MNDPGRYRRLVGKLIYLTVTWLDISFAVGMVSPFMSSPRTFHLAAVIQIVKYLKGIPGEGLCFRKYGHEKVEGYNDVDWTGSPADKRSITGYCTFVRGNLVSWKSKNKMSFTSQVQRPSIGLRPIQVGS
ncbi:putative mitochondrial protein AtMg00240 [Tasmannia lanceolata]|uniref:putative mitochondrial protein AtMg00240 n=1 Tax=Tasmannia lanceolata TaxID=3420 RepID=UPI0040636F04